MSASNDPKCGVPRNTNNPLPSEERKSIKHLRAINPEHRSGKLSWDDNWSGYGFPVPGNRRAPSVRHRLAEQLRLGTEIGLPAINRVLGLIVIDWAA